MKASAVSRVSDVHRKVVQEEGSLLTSFNMWGQTGGLYILRAEGAGWNKEFRQV